MKNDEMDVLSMMIRHEEAIKDLYEKFAGNFPEHNSFWQKLALEERGHAEQLKSLLSDTRIAIWFLRESRLKPQAVKTSLEFVVDQISKAKAGKFTSLQALSIARNLESALLERQLIKIKSSAPKELQWVLKTLTEETERHLKVIIAAINSEK